MLRLKDRFDDKGKKQATNGKNTALRCKIAWVTAVLFMFAGMLPATAFAHPPKNVTLSYDAAAKILKVTITHPSFTPSWHYIKNVAIEKNKQPVGSYPYKSQPGDEFAYTYEIPAVPGDTFVVNVYCSMYGSRTESLTVPVAPKP